MKDAIFIKARAMSMDTGGNWVVDHYCRINMAQVVSFRVVDADDKESMIYEVFFTNRSIPTLLSLDTEDIRGWVKS